MDQLNLESCQQSLLNMAKIIDDICRKNDIQYWIDGGTTLGAVRHGGFIPWDDDVDMCFLVDDFKKMRQILKEEIIAKHSQYILYNDHRPFKHYTEYFADTSVVRNGFYPLKIDLLMIKALPNTPESIRLDQKIVNSLKFYYNKSDQLNFDDTEFVKQHFKKGDFLFKRERFVDFFIKYIERLNVVKEDYLFCYPYNDFYVSREREFYTYDDIFPIKEIDFAGVKLFAPNNTNAYLTKLYGPNYMTPPPKEQQVPFADKISNSKFPSFLQKKMIYFLYLLKAIKNSFTLNKKIKDKLKT